MIQYRDSKYPAELIFILIFLYQITFLLTTNTLSFDKGIILQFPIAFSQAALHAMQSIVIPSISSDKLYLGKSRSVANSIF